MNTPRTFNPSSTAYVEELLAQYQANPASVSPEWQAYFLGIEANTITPSAGTGSSVSSAAAAKQVGVHRLIRAWRMRGHLAAHLNPLSPTPPETLAELTLNFYGLSEADLDSEFMTEGVVGQPTGKLRGILTALQRAYGGTIGVETANVQDNDSRKWVRAWWENPANHAAPTKDVKKKLYQGLCMANNFEKMLHTKFVGVKRFSLEGNDGVIPIIHRLVETAAADGAKHVVMGMAHRGRLNVLCNVMHKPVADMVAGFADKYTDEGGPTAGDVKYHAGKVYNHHAENGAGIELELMFNPSHLEAVNPVVLGAARAKASQYWEKAGQGDFGTVLSILMHGDAAVAGLGIVSECNNMSMLEYNTVGGTLHIVINNQVGFTAGNEESVGGDYCTDIFKSIGCPIIHANADDIEACWRATRFAWEYRQKFGMDVVLDFVGYRRWGHNEGDDPTFTQPQMYELIRSHPVPSDVYKAKLVEENVFSAAELETLDKAIWDDMLASHAEGMKGVVHKAKHKRVTDTPSPKTAIGKDTVAAIAKAWEDLPKGFVPNAKIANVVKERIDMLNGAKPLNWGAAETAAYGSLLAEGVSVRLTGEDSQRGTFSHRHAVLVGVDGSKWAPMAAMATKKARHAIYNSALNENATMGFEYGYAHATTNTLTLWEGQFGDFSNGGQVIIDQFIASAEAKWGQMNALGLLLPHGYEGQGPEHSSARVERYLQLCAEDNMRVCMPSTPGQMFHLLRRQALWSVKRPLIAFTPKSLLRNPSAVSPVEELTKGGWQDVIEDTAKLGKVKRVVLCSGKVYYDLAARRAEMGDDSIALVRVEQLYPFPVEQIGKILAAYKCKDVWWVQEEPRNMGAWWFVQENWNKDWGFLHYAGRPTNASPAVGTTSRHNKEQSAVVDAVFGELKKKVA